MRELTHNIIALIHYTELTETGWCEEAHERFIIATLWELKEPVILQQIKKGVSDRFPISLKNHELITILERLQKQGDVICSTDRTYRLSVDRSMKVKEAIEKATIREEKVKTNFCKRINSSSLEIKSEGVWDTFIERFLRPLVANEGARAYDFLVGGKKKIPPMHYVDNFLDAFPKNKDCIKQILIDFLNQDDPEIKTYLLTYLDSYFLMSASGLPDKVISEITSISTDGLEFVVFIDTNFIYSILNLHDNPSNQAANDLQELIDSLSKNIRIKLSVRRETIEETLASIRYHRKWLANTSTPPNVAEAATRIEISGVYRTFFQRVQEAGTRISAEDYFSPYEKNLVSILETKGISIFNESEPIKDYWQSSEIDEDIALQLQYEQEKHPDSPKSEQKIKHDVIFWHSLQDLRGRNVSSPLKAHYWIVTLDYRFLAWDKYKTQLRGCLPACMHPAQLIQLLRFFVPRTPQLENTLLGIVKFPALSKEFDPKMEQVCIRIINLVSRHEGIDDIPVSALTSILADEAIRTQLSEKNLSERDQIEVIHNSLTRILAEKETRLAERELKLKEKSEKVLQLEREVNNLAHQKELVSKSEVEETSKRKKAEDETIQIRQEFIQTKTQLAQSQKENRRYKTIFRFIFALSLFLVFGLVIFFLPQFIHWDWLLMHDRKIGIQLCIMGCLGGLLWVFFDPDKNRKWFALGSIVIGTIIAIIQII